MIRTSTGSNHRLWFSHLRYHSQSIVYGDQLVNPEPVVLAPPRIEHLSSPHASQAISFGFDIYPWVGSSGSRDLRRWQRLLDDVRDRYDVKDDRRKIPEDHEPKLDWGISTSNILEDTAYAMRIREEIVINSEEPIQNTRPVVVEKDGSQDGFGFLEFRIHGRPCLPLDGTKFIRFHTPRSEDLRALELDCVDEVYDLAQKHFPTRVRYWNQGLEGDGDEYGNGTKGMKYTWKEFKESLESFNRYYESAEYFKDISDREREAFFEDEMPELEVSS